jgi:hypothetical protein
MQAISYLQLEMERQDFDEQCDYRSACEVQKRIISEKERDVKSTAGDLGEAYLLLGRYLGVLHEIKAAELAYCRSLGLLRIFYGKGHAKVRQAMEQLQELREAHSPAPSTTIDRRRVEYKRAQLVHQEDVS